MSEKAKITKYGTWAIESGIFATMVSIPLALSFIYNQLISISIIILLWLPTFILGLIAIQKKDKMGYYVIICTIICLAFIILMPMLLKSFDTL